MALVATIENEASHSVALELVSDDFELLFQPRVGKHVALDRFGVEMAPVDYGLDLLREHALAVDCGLIERSLGAGVVALQGCGSSTDGSRAASLSGLLHELSFQGGFAANQRVRVGGYVPMRKAGYWNSHMPIRPV